MYLAYLAQHVLMLGFFMSIQAEIEKGKVVIKYFNLKDGGNKND